MTLEQVKKQSIQALEKSDSTFITDKYSKRVFSFLRLGAITNISNSINVLISSQKQLAQKARGRAVKCSENERTIFEKLKPFSIKINDQTRLKSLLAKLKEQQDILQSYNGKTALIEAVKESGILTRKELFRNYANLLTHYKDIIHKLINDGYSRIDDDIVLEASLRFDSSRFSSSFCDLFDRRSSSFKTLFGASFSENNDFRFSELSHVSNIEEIFDNLSTKNVELIYKKGISQDDAISQLFKNYFQIDYNIKYKNDEILDMSPGKRGLVLLQLILHISNATHPILIDQPEDNLDNRTISNELKLFISTKKLARQIIIVTHDANLVVLTDAENVIVSNQDGQQINRENAEYRFEYVAGSLENSFRLPNNQKVKGILFSCGIREHVCDVLEGGELAFKKREEKYGFSNR